MITHLFCSSSFLMRKFLIQFLYRLPLQSQNAAKKKAAEAALSSIHYPISIFIPAQNIRIPTISPTISIIISVSSMSVKCRVYNDKHRSRVMYQRAHNRI